MKKIKSMIALLVAVLIGINNVSAVTATKNIDASRCETVYTNYYFFIDANTTDYFNQKKLADIKHTNVAVYHNNAYQINNFDTTNIGYGQLAISKTTTTSEDGITSMSLSDFYRHYLVAMNLNGAYSSLSKNYIAAHDWYRVESTDAVSKGGNTLDLRKYSKQELMNASLDAFATFTRHSSVLPTAPNPFQLEVEREYFGYLTGMPIKYGAYEWYLQPQVYYIQYCAPKAVEEASTYNIAYKTNTTDVVTNMPQDITVNGEQDANIGSEVPVRNGYTFLGWNTEAAATTADTKYNSGSLYTDRKDLVLYAIWKANDSTTPSNPNLPENPQTAVTDYLLPFGGIISAAGAGLGLLKKKRTFKQF